MVLLEGRANGPGITRFLQGNHGTFTPGSWATGTAGGPWPLYEIHDDNIDADFDDPARAASAALVDAVLFSVDAQDWGALKAVLHPYLHWTDDAGSLRGRTKVIAHIKAHPVLAPPDACELRDGQVYRWNARVVASP